MKRTLIALLALSGMACASSITLSNDNSGTLVVHMNVETFATIAGTGFDGAGEVTNLFSYTGTWQDNTPAKLEVQSNGSSASHITGLYFNW